MGKNIFDVLWAFGVGGWVTAIGGFIGYAIGLYVRQGEGICSSNCTDPWMYAVVGLLPGILIAGYEWIEKKRKEREETIRWRKEMERYGFSDEAQKILNETKQK